MPKLVVSNAALVTLQWTYGTVSAVNVLGAVVGASTQINQALANSLDTAIKSSFTSSGLAARCATATTLAKVKIKDIRSPDLPEFIGAGAATAGTGVGDMLPRGNALVVTLRTAKSGKSFRGRVYLGGFTEAENDAAGGVGSALQTASTAFITAVSNNFGTNGLTLGVLSRPAEATSVSRTVTHGDGTTSTEVHSRPARGGAITAVTLVELRNATWDSQRRRSAPGSVSTLFGPLVSMPAFGAEA